MKGTCCIFYIAALVLTPLTSSAQEVTPPSVFYEYAEDVYGYDLSSYDDLLKVNQLWEVCDTQCRADFVYAAELASETSSDSGGYVPPGDEVDRARAQRQLDEWYENNNADQVPATGYVEFLDYYYVGGKREYGDGTAGAQLYRERIYPGGEYGDGTAGAPLYREGFYSGGEYGDGTAGRPTYNMYDDAVLRESRGLGVEGFEEGGLVPCGNEKGDPCGWDDVLQLVDNLIDWLVAFLAVAAVITIVIVGFKLVSSQGNTTAWDNAKESFTNVIIGILLILAAWLIVDTFLRVLTGDGINDLLSRSSGEEVEYLGSENPIRDVEVDAGVFP